MNDLTRLAQLAEQHALSYASPHHFCLSVAGLRSIIEAARTTPPPAPVLSDAVLAHLDDLKDDAAAHIWPDDLERCQTSECVVQVASVRMGSPDGTTVPLFSRDQVAEAIEQAIGRASRGAK